MKPKRRTRALGEAALVSAFTTRELEVSQGKHFNLFACTCLDCKNNKANLYIDR